MAPPNEIQPIPAKIPICGDCPGQEDLYALMCSIRLFERSLLKLFEKSRLAGTTHTCLGQESTAVGVVSCLDRNKDIVFSNHRGHGHFLAYCGEMELLYLEVMGRPEGACGGMGGSQHLHYKNFYSNGIQGGIVPNAVGMALAQQIRKTGGCVCVFLGDGTLGQGVVYESFNLAALWKAPVLFIIDNNSIAQSTPVKTHLAGSITARPAAFGIPVAEISGLDVEAIMSVANKALRNIRDGLGPQCVVINSVRLGPHSKGDDPRDAGEIESLRRRDPLAFTRKKLGDGVAEKIEIQASAMVGDILERALGEPFQT